MNKTELGKNYVLDVWQTLIANCVNILWLMSLFVGTVMFVAYINTLPEYAKILSFLVFLSLIFPRLFNVIDFQAIYKKRTYIGYEGK